MADSGGHLQALETAAGETQRALEAGISAADARWNDEVRRRFEADHLAAIRADARHLRIETTQVVQMAQQAIRELGEG